VAVLLPALALAPVSGAAAAPGQLYGFGENAAGQLDGTTATGSEAANPTPALIALPGATGPVVETAAGGRFTLALTSTNQLFAFGSNRYGQLGVAAGSGSAAANPTPRLVTLSGAGGRVAALAAGLTHSLALTSTGELYTFGENQFGQLGRASGSGTEDDNPAAERVLAPGLVGQLVQVAAGCEHSLALSSTGQLFAFGGNRYGELGTPVNAGSTNPNPTPFRVTLPGASGPVVQVAAGCEHSLALTSTGQLFAFGGNRYGELGSFTHAGTTTPNPTPALVGLPAAAGRPTAIAAGGFHSLVLTSGGAIYAFGRNQYGELGSAAGSGSESPIPTPVAVALPGAGAPAVGLAAGSLHSLAITASGQLYAFGSNRRGQLGSSHNSGTSSPNPTATAASLPQGTSIDAVGRGPAAEFTIAQVADLAVLSGSLPNGQVGVPYSASAVAAGGVGGYSWSASGLPPGLSIDQATGAIVGIPSAASTSSVVLRVTDAFGVAATSPPIALTIAPAAPARAFLSTTLTEAQIRQSLRQQLGMKGRSARISSLRKRRRYAYAFTALTAGTLAIEWWYLPPGTRLARSSARVLCAAGRLTFPTAGTRTIVLKLTRRGRVLLRHRRTIALTAKGSFTPVGKPTVTATKAFNLAR